MACSGEESAWIAVWLLLRAVSVPDAVLAKDASLCSCPAERRLRKLLQYCPSPLVGIHQYLQCAA